MLLSEHALLSSGRMFMAFVFTSAVPLPPPRRQQLSLSAVHPKYPLKSFSPETRRKRTSYEQDRRDFI